MATVTQRHQIPSTRILADDTPSRGFLGEVTGLITNPAGFFTRLGTNHRTTHTLWAAILILAVVAFNALQTPTTNETSQVDNGGGIPFDAMASGEEIPFDMGFPTDGGTSSGATSGDPSANWMTALKAAGRQIMQWFALVLLLSEVTMFAGHRPQLGKSLTIAIWTSTPLALLAGLQVIYVTGGGSIQQPGFTGFLAEWPAFTEMNIHFQSFIHALASHLTVFWLWSLGLVYLGARLTLHGKRPIIMLVLVLWITTLGITYGFQSYATLTENTDTVDSLMPGEFQPEMPFEPNETLPNDEISAEGGIAIDAMDGVSIMPKVRGH